MSLLRPEFDKDSPVFMEGIRDVTSRVRRSLMIVSCVGILIVAGGVLPTEIPAIGVKLDVGDTRLMLWAVALMTLYLGLQFYLKARKDASLFLTAMAVYGWKRFGTDGAGDVPVENGDMKILKVVFEDRATMSLHELFIAFQSAGGRLKWQMICDYALPVVLAISAIVLVVIKIIVLKS